MWIRWSELGRKKHGSAALENAERFPLSLPAAAGSKTKTVKDVVGLYTKRRLEWGTVHCVDASKLWGESYPKGLAKVSSRWGSRHWRHA
jgi:hypothetical protein